MECISRRTLGRTNQPPAAIADVKLGVAVNVPIGERLIAPTASGLLDDESSSDFGSLSQPMSSSSDSSPGPRRRVRRLTCRALSPDSEEVSNSMDEGVTAAPVLEF